MSNFQPRTDYYGRMCYVEDEDGKVVCQSKLVKINSPHWFTLENGDWEIDSSNDFWENDDGTVTLWCAWQ